MFFQMATRQGPMDEVRAFLERVEAARRRPPSTEDVRRVLRDQMGTGQRSPAPQLDLSRSDTRRRFELPGKPEPGPSWEAHAEELRRGAGLNGYGYVPNAGDVNLLARAGYSEFSRESSLPDLHAGIWAILNRVRPDGGYGQHRNELGPSLEEVLTRQGPGAVQQFPFMPRGGVDAPGGSPAWQRSANPDQMIPQERKAWELTLQAVKDVLSGAYPDPTAGASFYRNRTAEEDDWWRSLRPSPYRSPTRQNFFYQAPEETRRPFLDKPSPYSGIRFPD